MGMRPAIELLINEVNSILDEGLDPSVARTLSRMSQLAQQQTKSAKKLGISSAHKLTAITHTRVADAATAQMGGGDAEADAEAQPYVDFHDHHAKAHNRRAQAKARKNKIKKGTGPGPHATAPKAAGVSSGRSS